MSGRMLIEVPFTHYAVEPYPGSVKFKKVYRPIIPVTLMRKERLVQLAGLLDSGADYNLFHAEIASYLGLPFTKGSKVRLGGIGGSITGYFHRLNIKIGSYIFKSKAIFSKDLPEGDVVILGIQGFFDACKIVINYPNSIQILRH